MEEESIQQGSRYTPSTLLLRFPPFALIGRVLLEVYQNQASVILTTPVWQTQVWLSGLHLMSVKTLLLLPETKNYLKDPARNYHPLTQQNSLKLVASTISGKTYRQSEF